MHGDLDDDFDLLGERHKKRIDLDEIALRAARREPPPGVQPKVAKAPLGARLKHLFSTAAAQLTALIKHSVAVSVVIAITAAAVSYGLDPDHVLDAVALERAEASLASLKTQVSSLFSL